MKVYSSSEIRNVAVVGHNDTGKTTLVSQLLFDAGVTTRLVRVGHPHAHELEVGAGVDAGDGVPADVAGGPGDDAEAHSSGPRSGRAMSRLGTARPPVTSKTDPVQ